MLEFPRPYLKCVGWGCDGSESHKQSETGKWANLQYSIPVVSSGAASLCLWEFWIHSLKASSQISRGVETRTNMKGKGTETTVIFQLPDLCRTNKTAVLQFIGLIKGTSQMKMWWNAACLTFCLGVWCFPVLSSLAPAWCAKESKTGRQSGAAEHTPESPVWLEAAFSTNPLLCCRTKYPTWSWNVTSYVFWALHRSICMHNVSGLNLLQVLLQLLELILTLPLANMAQ